MPKAKKKQAPAWWHAAAVVLAGAVVYGNSLAGPFVFDDRASIVDNRTIERLWTPAVLAAPHETPTAGRPLANVSFALNYAMGGRDVVGYHALNIGIHIACALLLLGLARRVLPAGVALAAALLWTVHPLATDAVSYVTQRTELLMALCYLLTLYAAARAHEDAGARSRWDAVAIAACALGMASKESMVTAPLMVMLYDRVFLFDSFAGAWRERRRLYAGLMAGWIVLGALLWTGPRNLSAGFTAHDTDVWTYLLNQTVMMTRYLQLAVWPRGLTLYYGWPLPLTLRDVLPYALLISALLLLTASALWRRPKLGFIGAWFFVMLAPTSSVVPIATEVGAERRAYLALVAIVIGAVALWRRVAGPWAARLTWLHAAVLSLVVLGLAAGTRARNREYASSLRLAETTLARWPTPAAHSMYGTELAAAGRMAEAEVHLRQAASVYPPARYYLATVLAASGHRAEAIDHFRGFIASQPPALDQVVLARAMLGDALFREGRLDEAAAEYRRLLETRPGDADAMDRLGAILIRQQAYGEAMAIYDRILAARPDDVRALMGAGIARASTGEIDKAVALFQRAVDLDPGNALAQQNLARALDLRNRRSPIPDSQ